MFGRFFAFEMGCPDDTTYLNADGTPSSDMQTLSPDQGSETQVLTSDQSSSGDQGQPAAGGMMICECKGLGCNKCKRKKAKVITLTGARGPVPVMNTPLSPFQPSMIMMARRNLF